MSSFWSVWIVVLTVIVIVGNVWLLLANRKSTNGPDKTTGHAYDGIEEYDNPLPAWWFWGFIVSVIWGIGYLIAYPGLGNFQGLLGWSSEGQLQQEIVSAKQKYGPVFERFAALPVEQVARDPQAVQMGQRLFANNCSQCHGVDARGSFGFPNLADKDWLWGGDPAHIQQTVTHGRQGAMPGWKTVIGEQGVRDVAAHVLTLGGRAAVGGDAPAGKAHFDTFCAACHGPGGKGNPAMGAPDLTDDIWLYGGSPLWVQQTIRDGRTGTMPAFGESLEGAKIHLLIAYVYSLSLDDQISSR